MGSHSLQSDRPAGQDEGGGRWQDKLPD